MATVMELDGMTTLADIIGPALRVLFVGYNPNPYALEHRHYYARKANRFWEDLHESGFIPRPFRGPDEDLDLLVHGLGVTDVVKRPTPTMDALTPAELRAGYARLDGLLARYHPAIVCFNGLGLLPGYQRWGQPPASVLIRAVPSTSPRNNGLRQARLQAFRDLKTLADSLPSRP